jgi:hypothetical protein
MILLGGNRDADDADGIEDAVVNPQNLDIKLVMVSRCNGTSGGS